MRDFNNKLKNTPPTLNDADSYELLKHIVEQSDSEINTWTFFSREAFDAVYQDTSLFPLFVEKVLLTQTYIEGSDGTRVPTYEPFHTGHCFSEEEEWGHREHWFGWYTNCLLLVTEFLDHPEDSDSLILFLDRQTADLIEQIDDDS